MKIKTTKITDAGLTTVPAAIRTALNVKAGDSVEWHIHNRKVIVIKAETKK